MSEIPFRQFVEARRAWGPAISPDGKSLAYVSDLSGYPEAYLHQGPDHDPLPLTEYRERVDVIRWTPDGRLLVLDTDLGGDECWAIRTVRPDGTGHGTLSHDPSVMHLMGEISADGRLLSVATNERDRALFDVGVIDLETGLSRTLLEGDESEMPGAVSPDGRRVVAGRMFGSFRQDLLLIETESGAVSPITPDLGAVRHQGAAFEPSGASLLLLTDRDRDFLGLFRLHLEDHRLEPVHAPDDRDVDRFVLSADGRTALLVENRRGWSRLLILDMANGEAKPVEHPDGVVTGLSLCADGSRGAFSLDAPTEPSEVFWLDTADGAVTRATHSPREGLPVDDLIAPEEVRFSSFDGVEIPGWLYLPTGYSGVRPAVVKIHGGPESQAVPSYDPVTQYLLSRGFAVYAPNVRGSTGYGRAFAALDDVRLRFDAVKDLAAAAEFLKESGRVDGEKLSLYGGSYGGFMVLAGLAFFPDLWAAGVDIVGIANFRTFLRNTGPYRRKWRMEEYGDLEVDGDFLDQISPVRHAGRIRAPLLVIQGENDPRVPRDEAEQIVAAVRETGGVAEYVLYPDEGHGVVKLPNRLNMLESVAAFLGEYGM